ncbi:Mechanosensory protein 2 [Halotydeus destructor]|nr:Mechanosensory protein 2 [Halotydeus destructor]
MPSSGGYKNSVRYYYRRFWHYLVDMSGVGGPNGAGGSGREGVPREDALHDESYIRPPDEFDEDYRTHPGNNGSYSVVLRLDSQGNSGSMERIERIVGCPPPPSSQTGQNGLGGSRRYSYNGPPKQQDRYHRKKSVIADVAEDPALCAVLLTMLSVILLMVSLPFSLFFCVKILSKDSVTVAVDAVVYFRISNAIASVSNVEDYARSTRLLAATTLRNVLGTKNLSEILSDREAISHMIQSALDDATDHWGVKVERVEIKDVRLPVQLQRAMAAEAEATREARAKVIAAEGEQRASRALKQAAEVISQSPSALQLRYLQTLNSIAAEKNSTIVFPVPMELFRGFNLRIDDTQPSIPANSRRPSFCDEPNVERMSSVEPTS